jgi:hypothetical protein
MSHKEYMQKLAEMKSLEVSGAMPRRGTKARARYDEIMDQLYKAATSK